MCRVCVLRLLLPFSPRGSHLGVPCRAAAAERLRRRLRLPALEDADTARVDQVPADRDVEADYCPASLFDDAHTARKVGLALPRLNGDVSCNDDHVLSAAEFGHERRCSCRWSW
jgi:hypothetical protein